VRLNLATGYPPQVAMRLVDGPRVWVQDPASGRVFSDEAVINIVLPFAASFLFMVATMSSSGYMLQVVADEKENRTMEIMLTSITPLQLISGKVLGLLAVALTQLAIYAATAIGGLVVAARYVPAIQEISPPWGYLGVMALFFFPSFGLIAAVMVAIGSAVTELQQGQQVAGLLNLVFMMPLLLLVLIFENPGGPVVVFLSLFPPTAFLTVSLRWGLGSVPLWQLLTAWTLLAGALAFMVWAAARIFRAGMLQYGQPLSFKGALAALRTS
jgi:ABC-2 type transport system permease protein